MYNRGFALLEVLLSIALFVIVATALVVALDRLAESSKISRIESRIFQRMESVMTEFTHLPRPGRFPVSADAFGIEAQVTIEPQSFTSLDGAAIDSMYQIHIEAWHLGTPDQRQTIQRLVYSPPPQK